jgi:ComF family protein
VDYLDEVAAWGWHRDPLRKAVLGLKYGANLAMGDALCQHLLALVTPWKKEIDLIMPIPLSRERERARGYNQAALIARPLGQALDLAYRPKALDRVRDTDSQVGKNLSERRKNVSGAFRANSILVNGKRVLLVDDVLTTGSTLDAAAEALKQAGAARVLAVVVSRAE